MRSSFYSLSIKVNFPENNLHESIIPCWHMALLTTYIHRQYERNFSGIFFFFCIIEIESGKIFIAVTNIIGGKRENTEKAIWK